MKPAFIFSDINRSVHSQGSIYIGVMAVLATADTVSMQLDKAEMQLLVSPNPAKNVLQVQTASNLACNGVLTITDIMGRQVYRKDIMLQPDSNNIPINILLFGPGIYNVRLVNGNENHVKQFIKE